MMPLADSTPDTSGLSPTVIDRIRTVLGACPAVERALLYGSRAKGNYHRGSDIDLALEGQQLDDTQLLALENQLDNLLLPYHIDLSHLASIQNEALLEHIGRVGRVFYER
jgi:predicted nucleotidyltransferase